MTCRKARRSRSRAAVSVLLSVAAASLAVGAGSANAADAAYGGVDHWGQYDASGTDPQGIVDPFGFGVDPSDSDAVYILDRTNVHFDAPPYSEDFRLRKFMHNGGTPLGTATFSVTGTAQGDIPRAVGVAIDSSNHLAYVAAVAGDGTSTDGVLNQIRVYSTQPDGSGNLVAGDGDAGTLLTAPDSDLKEPKGIAVDPRTHDVVVIGTDSSTGLPLVERFKGPGEDEGAPDGTWSPDAVDDPSVSEYAPTSVTIDPQGRIDVLLTQTGNATFTRLVRIAPDMSSDLVTPAAAEQAAQGATFSEDDPSSTLVSGGATDIFSVSSRISAAPDGTLFALSADGLVADYFDQTADGTFHPVSPFTQTSIGVRQLADNGDDLGIVGGGGATDGGCDINSGTGQPLVWIAAGADGHYFVLTENFVDNANDNKREVYEFGPGGMDQCPVPTARITATDRDGAPIGNGDTVAPGSAITVDASGSDLAGGSLFEVDWDLNGNTTDGPHGDGFEVSHRPTSAQDRDEDGNLLPVIPAQTTETLTAPSTDGSTVTARLHVLTTGGTSAVVSRTFTVRRPDSGPVCPDANNPDCGGGPVCPDASNPDCGPAPCQTNCGGGRTDTPPPTTSTTAPTPPPPVQRDTTPTNVSPRLSVRSGALQVGVSCPKTKASCSGTVQVKAVVKVKKGRKTTKKTIVVGSGKFTVAGGKGKTLTVKLSKAGASALKAAHGKLKVSVVIAARDTYGGKKTTTKSVTITTPKKTKRAAKKK